jgi:aminopeptidase N
LLPASYYYPVAQQALREAIDTIAHPFSDEILAEGFASDDLKIRQILATHMQKIPSIYKARYETLLNDMSYRTVESALFNLWVNFPEQKATYLDATNNQEGFRDKSLRSLWLTLALVTPGYNEAGKAQYHDELISYTDPKYGFERRQHAFSLLLQIQAYNEVAIKNLINGTGHHNWRFKKQCKQLLEELKKNPALQEWINQHEE